MTHAEFTALVGADGEPVLQHQGRPLPVGTRALRRLLMGLGVRPAPGQAVAVEPSAAGRVVEEALSELGERERESRRERAELIAAWLAFSPIP